MDTTSDLRQVLAEIASRTFQKAENFVGLSLFPLWRTPIIAGTYYMLDDASFFDGPPPGLSRAPGSPFARTRTKLSNDKYACQPYGHEEPIGHEENSKYASPGQSQAAATRRGTNIMLLRHELSAYAKATSADVPSANVAIPWTD